MFGVLVDGTTKRRHVLPFGTLSNRPTLDVINPTVFPPLFLPIASHEHHARNKVIVRQVPVRDIRVLDTPSKEDIKRFGVSFHLEWCSESVF